MTTRRVWLTRDEIAALVQLRHPSPHSLLGLHPLGEDRGLVARAFRPDARRIDLVPDDDPGTGLPMQRIHPSGLFELHLPDLSTVFRYGYVVEPLHGGAFPVRDPYAHLPTMGDVDLHLAGEGRHEELYRFLGAQVREHEGEHGVSFAVWAPHAARVSVVGDFNGWDGRYHAMRMLGASGIWEIFIPGVEAGANYRYEILLPSGRIDLRSDPMAFAAELRPKVASRVVDLNIHTWEDAAWMKSRAERNPMDGPLSIYEVHLGSWIRKKGNAFLTYRELAGKLVPHVKEMGFTHIELMPVAEYPFDGSWGYQVTGYYAPTRRFGEPEDFMYFVDVCHRNGIGVLMDWVPAHFPKDAFALARFDGTELYEHADPRQGEHPDWGTLVFNYGRNEVRNFLIANAMFWLDRYHIDGFRVDAVASMLYLDYSRQPGEWVPNKFGGRESLEAIEFLKEFNAVVHTRFPGALTVAEESTAWPGVTHPVDGGGLGFGGKWNMGFMHDVLAYFKEDPVHRVHHHDKLTFGLLYAFNERFILPFSHDEVVHGKASMLAKMPGDEWRRFANLRALYTYMFAHPGKKLLFMGAELAAYREWSHEVSLEWDLLEHAVHRGIRDCVAALNHFYRGTPALWERDHRWEGFTWIDFDDAPRNIVSWIRRGEAPAELAVCVFNFSPVPQRQYVVGVPSAKGYVEAFNSDDERYGGSGAGNPGTISCRGKEAQGQPDSVVLTLPPLAGLILRPVSAEGQP